MKQYFLSFTVLSFAILLNTQQCTDIKKIKTMITYQEGLNLAIQKLKVVSKNNPEYVIWEAKTVVKEYGWVFRPESRQFISRGYFGAKVPGMGLILVNKFDSTCIMVPTSMSTELFIQYYEEKLKEQ